MPVDTIVKLWRLTAQYLCDTAYSASKEIFKCSGHALVGFLDRLRHQGGDMSVLLASRSIKEGEGLMRRLSREIYSHFLSGSLARI